LMVGKRRAVGEEELLKLLEETYLELSARLGWNPINCRYFSYRYNTCYGAPIFLGNWKEVWKRERVDGLFDVLNRKLKAMGYEPLSWEQFRGLMRRIERQGVIWVNLFIAPNGKVEPHDITIMKPTFLRD
jgi:hypothetical protein